MKTLKLIGWCFMTLLNPTHLYPPIIIFKKVIIIINNRTNYTKLKYIIIFNIQINDRKSILWDYTFKLLSNTLIIQNI